MGVFSRGTTRISGSLSCGASRSQASLQKAQGPGVCKLPKPPASRALCQAKGAPRAAFPSGCLAAQTKRWAEGIRVPAPLPGRASPSASQLLAFSPAFVTISRPLEGPASASRGGVPCLNLHGGLHRHTDFSKNHDPFNSCLNSECIQMIPADPLRAGPCSGCWGCR